MSERGNTCVVHVVGEGRRTCRWEAAAALIGVNIHQLTGDAGHA